MRHKPVAAVAAVVSLGGGGWFAAISSGEASKSPPATFKTLKQPRTKRDRLPAAAQTDSLKRFFDVDSTRYIGRSGDRKAFIAEGVQDTTCYLTTDREVTTFGCFTPDSLTERVNSVGNGTRSGRVDMIVAVPDAYDRIDIDGRRFKKRRNALIVSLPGKDGQKVELKGPQGELTGVLDLAPTR